MAQARERDSIGSMKPGRRALTAGLVVGVSVHAMDAFAIQVALPALTADLGARDAYTSVLTTYLLANVVGLVDGGRRCDARGLVHAQAVGLLTFAAGLVLSASAGDLALVLIGRILQGFGGGTLATVIYAAVQQAYAREERPMVLAWLSAAWGVGGAALPLPLGWLVDHVGWRSVFLVGLPGLLLTWLLTRRALLEVPASTAEPPRSGTHATVLATLGLVLGLALAIHMPEDAGRLTLPLRMVGALIAAMSCVRIFPAGTFRLRPIRPASVSAKILLCAGYFGAEAFLPLVLEELHDFRARDVSWTLTVASVTWTLGAFVQARTAGAVGARRIATLGLALVALGNAGLLLLLVPGSGALSVYFSWAIAPLGMGFAYTTVLDAAMADTPPGEEGATGTAVGLADSVGAAFGTGLAGLLVAMGGGPAREALPTSVRLAWLGTIALALLSLPAVLQLPRAHKLVSTSGPRLDDGPAQ